MSYKDESFYKRLNATKQDFNKGLKQPIEEQFGVRIYGIEDLPRKELVNRLDFAGVDAFVWDKGEHETYGLASRVNYAWFRGEPSFSFRFAIWDHRKNDWRFEREYQRKLQIANRPEKQIFPELHVESFSSEKATGRIEWAVMARTKDVLNYINDNIVREGDTYLGRNGVIIKEPRTKERRLVVAVSAEALDGQAMVKEIKLK